MGGKKLFTPDERDRAKTMFEARASRAGAQGPDTPKSSTE